MQQLSRFPVAGALLAPSPSSVRVRLRSFGWDGITTAAAGAPSSFSDHFNGSFRGSFVSLLQSITSKALQDAHCLVLLEVGKSKLGGIVIFAPRCHISPPAAARLIYGARRPAWSRACFSSRSRDPSFAGERRPPRVFGRRDARNLGPKRRVTLSGSPSR